MRGLKHVYDHLILEKRIALCTSRSGESAAGTTGTAGLSRPPLARGQSHVQLLGRPRSTVHGAVRCVEDSLVSDMAGGGRSRREGACARRSM